MDMKFVEALLRALEEQNIEYCILRNVEEIEAGNAHDIDMTVSNKHLDDFERIALQVARHMGWKLHLKIGSSKDKINIKCYHFFTVKDKHIYIAHFDIFPTFAWNGYILLDNDILLTRIDKNTFYHNSAPEIESVTKLFIRLLYNGYIKTKYKNYILQTFRSMQTQVSDVMRNFLDEETCVYVVECILNEKWNELEKNRKKLVTAIRNKAKNRKISQTIYLMRKAIGKAGLMVAFEGTDGSGKSTIISGLSEVLDNTFPNGMLDYYHWRPGFIKKEKRTEDGEAVVVKQPHAKKSYGKLKSFAKYMFFNFDYIFGYWCKVRWQISKGHLVVFDRYYYDYYMDKLRYRLNISNTTLNLFRFMIPKPDITFLLIGDSKVLYERKKEISVQEIQEQINRLIQNQEKFHNSVIVDVNQPINKVVFDVAETILNKCSEKVKK